MFALVALTLAMNLQNWKVFGLHIEGARCNVVE